MADSEAIGTGVPIVNEIIDKISTELLSMSVTINTSVQFENTTDQSQRSFMNLDHVEQHMSQRFKAAHHFTRFTCSVNNYLLELCGGHA